MHSFPSYYYLSHSPPSPPPHSPSSYYQYPSPMSRVQGQLLEVTVVGCNKLKDTEWISRQDPYVCVEYGSSKFRTRTCTDGGKNPTFQERFVFTMIEGLREMIIVVWNSNTISTDDFIGSGRAQLHKVISEGFDDSTWPIQTKTGRHAGEVRLIMHYPNAKKQEVSAHSAPHYAASHPPASMYPTPGPPAPYPSPYGPPTTAYSGTSAYPSYPPNSAYPPNPAYPPSHSYPPTSAYPPPSAGYPPSPYPPPLAYPPPAYPPPPQSSPYYPPHQGSYPGAYLPPPY